MCWTRRLIAAVTDDGRRRRWYGIVRGVVGKGASPNFSLPRCAADEIHGDDLGRMANLKTRRQARLRSLSS
jgi:hypothetical protein